MTLASVFLWELEKTLKVKIYLSMELRLIIENDNIHEDTYKFKKINKAQPELLPSEIHTHTDTHTPVHVSHYI